MNLAVAIMEWLVLMMGHGVQADGGMTEVISAKPTKVRSSYLTGLWIKVIETHKCIQYI